MICHNYYREPGGEDVVFEAEADLLERRGHRVERLVLRNDEIPEQPGPLAQAKLAARTVWSGESDRKVRSALRRAKPDVVHFHNTFPLISPSAYVTCRKAGVPVVQTLHNYRLLCANASFFRDGHPCEDCLGKTPPWPGVLHGCYRGSRLQSTAVVAMLTAHRLRRTWSRDVGVYVALTEFARRKFVEGGLPSERIVVKPNFIDPDPGAGAHEGDFALFAGRLAPNKGVATLLTTWQRTTSAIPLRIAGDGELADIVRRAASADPRIRYEGRLEREQLLELMRQARLLVFPSEWYESFPVTLVEAFACGLPVVASRLGAMAEIVEDGQTGLHFTPGDAGDLAARVEWAWASPEKMRQIGSNARRQYETSYTADTNYEQLMRVYERAMATTH